MSLKKYLIVALIWLIPLALVWYLLLSFRYGSFDFNDGTYSIMGGNLIWEHQVTNNAFKSTRLINSMTGEKLYLSGEDFSLKVGLAKNLGWLKKGNDRVYGSRNANVITPETCEPVALLKQKGKTTFVFYYRPLKLFLKLNYCFYSNLNYFQRTLSIESKNEEKLIVEEVSLGNWAIQDKLSGGGIGLPVFINDNWFFSGETPWFDNVIEAHNLLLSHHPSVYVNKDETWTSDSTIVGGDYHQAKNILLDYIRSTILPPRFFTLYNTWYDLRENELNVANITTNFSQLAKKLNDFEANIDYCVIDDGWNDNDTLYSTKTNNFPKGIIEVSDNIASFHSKLGLWLPFSGLYLNNKALKQFGYEEAHPKFYCLSGTNYFSALSKHIIDMIKRDHIAFFKHDFNFFDCVMPGHGHLRNLTHSKEANMRQTAKLLDLERKTNSDIVQAITTGINLSPWWLKFAQILWMGGDDINFDKKFPATDRAETEMTYRDACLYEILNKQKKFIPLYAIMTHGIIDGKLNSVDPLANDEQWSDYVMNYFGRGTGIRELYLYPPKLNKKKAEILARGINWACEHNDQMLNAEMILGDPGKNEVYGFKGHDDKGHIYVSIRNPKLTDVDISIKDLGIDTDYYLISYPYHKICEAKYFPVVRIPGESVLIIEALHKKNLKENDVINARSTDPNDSSEITIFFDSPSEVPVYLYSSKKPSGVEARKLSGKFWQINRDGYFLNDNHRLTQHLFNNDGFEFTLSLPDNSAANLLLTSNDRNLNIELTDNCVEQKSTKIDFFKDANWKIDIFSLRNGTHNILGKYSKALPSKNTLKMHLRVKYLIPSLTIKVICNKNDIKTFNSPSPVSQNIFVKTFDINVDLNESMKQDI